MIRKFSVLPIVLALLFNLLPTAQVYATDAFLKPAMAAAVRVDIFDEQGEVSGWGSGSLIDPQGLVLTNYHVVAANAAPDQRVSVWLADPKADDQTLEYQGVVIAQDPQLDLAVIHLDAYIDAERQSHPLTAAQKFPVVALGNSDAMTPGDVVYVLGYPMTAPGQLALTDGKVSNWLKENGDKWLVAQAQAAHGNSGGLMVNSQGQLIGVPTEIKSDPEVSGALLYARPINSAKSIIIEAQQALAQPGPTSEPGNICQDDFTNNALGWNLGQPSDQYVTSDYTIKNGVLQQNVRFKQDAFTRLAVPCGFTRNFRLTVDVTVGKATGTGVGVIVAFRQNSNGDGYLAQFLTDGTYRLLTMQGEQWTDLQADPTSNALHLAANQANQLVVEAQDSSLTLSANGEELVSVEDTTFDRAGDISLGLIGTADAQASVSFDNLLITDPAQPDLQEDWQQLQDPNGVVSMEVPAHWQQLTSARPTDQGISLAAGAPDNSAASMLIILPDEQGLDPIAVLNQMNQSAKRNLQRGCTTKKRVEYSDQRFKGSYDVWSNCTRKTERLITLVVQPQDDTPILLTLAAYFATDNWPLLIQHMLDSVTIQAQQAGVPATVVVDQLRMRGGPGGGYPVVAVVEKGDRVTIIGQQRACLWLQIETLHGVKGWILGTQHSIELAQSCAEIQASIKMPN